MEVSSLSFGSGTDGVVDKPKTPQDEFLNLLVAQLEHQDPMSPQDSAQFVAQLAQFTQVEQTTETNARLESLEAVQSAGLRASFANIVGREVTARADEITVEGGQVNGARHAVHLEGRTSDVKVTVRDEHGAEVRTIELGPRGGGDVDIGWDGTDKDGVPVPDGKYTFEVHAKDMDGESMDSHVRVFGRATALDFEGGAIKFKVGAAEIAPADIIAIAE